MGDERRFEGRTVAVPGAGGFIGNAVSRHLAGHGARVIGLDLDHAAASRIEEAGASFVAADVRDRARLDAVLDGTELVVHAAALVHEWGSMDDFVRANVRGTANVVAAPRATGAGRPPAAAMIGKADAHQLPGPERFPAGSPNRPAARAGRGRRAGRGG